MKKFKKFRKRSGKFRKFGKKFRKIQEIFRKKNSGNFEKIREILKEFGKFGEFQEIFFLIR